MSGTGLTIIPKQLRINYSPGRAGRRVRAVVLHVSDGTEAGAVSWFNSPVSKVSAHYFVCKDGRVLRFVNETDTAWGNGLLVKADLSHPLVKEWAQTPEEPSWPAGLPNLETVSIEREGKPGEPIPAAQWAALVTLTAGVCQRHRLLPDRSAILGHYQLDSVNRPNCPGWDAPTWSRFIAGVAGLVDSDTDLTDAKLEAAYQRDAARLGAKRFAGELRRPFYTGKVLVCQRGVVTADGTDIMGNVIDDFLTLNDQAGALVRY